MGTELTNHGGGFKTHSQILARYNWIKQSAQCIACIEGMEAGLKNREVINLLRGTQYYPDTITSFLSDMGIDFLARFPQHGLFRIVTADNPLETYDQMRPSIRGPLSASLMDLVETTVTEEHIRIALEEFVELSGTKPDRFRRTGSDLLICRQNLAKVLTRITERNIFAGIELPTEADLVPEFNPDRPEERMRRLSAYERRQYIDQVNSVARRAETRIFRHGRNQMGEGLDDEIIENEETELPLDTELEQNEIIALEEVVLTSEPRVWTEMTAGENISQARIARQPLPIDGHVISEEMQVALVAERILRQNLPEGEISVEAELARMGLKAGRIEQLTYELADQYPEMFRVSAPVTLVATKQRETRDLTMSPKEATFLKLWALGHTELTIAGLIGLNHSRQEGIIMKACRNLRITNDELKNLIADLHL